MPSVLADRWDAARLVVRDWLHVGLRQVGALADRTPPEEVATVVTPCPRGGVPVLLLPGVYEPWRYLMPLARHLHGLGHPVHVLPGLGINRRPLVDTAGRVESALLAGGPSRSVVVAHSKGGLVGLLAMARPALSGRILGVVAVATPFGGSSRGVRIAARTHLREFAPTASAITSIARLPDAARRVSSIAPAWDEMIPEGSALAGARNVAVPVRGHFLPMVDPTVWQAVHDEVHVWGATEPASEGEDV